jgi:hypothetical protein
MVPRATVLGSIWKRIVGFMCQPSSCKISSRNAMVKYIFASLISFLRVVLNNAMLTGFAKDEWKDTTSLLRTYSQKRGNIVKVGHENGVVNMIMLQHARQRKLFELFGQMLQIDSTYMVAKSKYPLCNLLVRNNFGRGIPVAHAFLRNETKESLMEFLRLFAKVHSINRN